MSDSEVGIDPDPIGVLVPPKKAPKKAVVARVVAQAKL